MIPPSCEECFPQAVQSSGKGGSAMSSWISMASFGRGPWPKPMMGGCFHRSIAYACFFILTLLTMTVWSQSGSASCRDVEYCEARGGLGNCELDFAWYDCQGVRWYTPRTCRDGEMKQSCMCTCYGDGYGISYWDVRREAFIHEQWWCLRSCPIGDWEYAMRTKASPSNPVDLKSAEQNPSRRALMGAEEVEGEMAKGIFSDELWAVIEPPLPLGSIKHGLALVSKGYF